METEDNVSNKKDDKNASSCALLYYHVVAWEYDNDKMKIGRTVDTVLLDDLIYEGMAEEMAWETRKLCSLDLHRMNAECQFRMMDSQEHAFKRYGLDQDTCAKVTLNLGIAWFRQNEEGKYELNKAYATTTSPVLPYSKDIEGLLHQYANIAWASQMPNKVSFPNGDRYRVWAESSLAGILSANLGFEYGGQRVAVVTRQDCDPTKLLSSYVGELKEQMIAQNPELGKNNLQKEILSNSLGR